MVDVAYAHADVDTPIATPVVVSPAPGSPQTPVPIPLVEKEATSGDDRLGVRATAGISQLRCPTLIGGLRRRARDVPPNLSSLRQRTRDELCIAWQPSAL